jgi:replication-associated recombination protein RarA
MKRDVTGEYFPFRKLGLDRNPFCTQSDDEWALSAWLHPLLADFIDAQNSVIQVLGSSGTGKTSALLALKVELERRGKQVHYLYLHPDQRPPRIGIILESVLLVDEIERLPIHKQQRLIWRALAQASSGLRLAFSSHHDLRLEVPHLALEQLPTLTLPAITSTQLEALLNQRVRTASPNGSLPVWIERSAAELLLERYLGDLRTAERALYEVFQILDEKGGLDRLRLGRMLKAIDEPKAPG